MTAYGNQGGTSMPTNQTKGMTGTVGDIAGEAKDVVGVKVDEAAAQVKQQALTVQQRVRTQAIGQADARKAALADRGHEIVHEAEKIAQQLRRDGMEAPATFVESATRQLHDVVDYVAETPVERMLSDAATRARRSPLLFAGMAFGVGIAAARLMKAEPVRPSAIEASGATPLPATRTRRFERTSGTSIEAPATTTNQPVAF